MSTFGVGIRLSVLISLVNPNSCQLTNAIRMCSSVAIYVTHCSSCHRALYLVGALAQHGPHDLYIAMVIHLHRFRLVYLSKYFEYELQVSSTWEYT